MLQRLGRRPADVGFTRHRSFSAQVGQGRLAAARVARGHLRVTGIELRCGRELMIDRIPELVNADANLIRRGRFLSTTFLLEVGEQGYLVKILEGRVASITPGPF